MNKTLRDKQKHQLAKQVKEDINRLNRNTNKSAFETEKKPLTIEMVEKGIVKHPQTTITI